MRILITHANTPYFNTYEQIIFEKRFFGLLKILENLSLSYNIRSNNHFVQKTGAKFGARFDNERPIQALVAEYDAVISTPSTALLPFLEMHIPVMQVVIRPGPPMLRSAYMSFCECDDERELTKLYRDKDMIINPRLEMQNKVFKYEYMMETYSKQVIQVSPFVQVDTRLKQLNRTIRTSIYVLGILEMFLSNLRTLIKRRRF